ncbi:hypothetical protein BKI52_38735 [marine bacterium AO1-C]|nr:hypothetical protein BKI52_38735 [marine bacterium AO1-C]
MGMKKYYSLLLVAVICGLSACSSNDVAVNDNGFDRSTLLVNIADNLIVPSFQDLKTKVATLETASNTFTTTADATNLDALQAAWEAAMTSFVKCAPFAFGPADLPLGTFVEVLGTFPISTTKIETNVSNTSFSLSASFDRDVRGFMAVEYLIYNLNGDADVLANYGTGSDNRKNYLKLIVAEIKTNIDAITAAWEGAYRTTFTSNTETSAGSPISLLYNSFVKDYENIKNFKVELPAGLQAGQTAAEPTKVEAYYSGISLNLIKEHFATTEKIWLGTGLSGTDGVGFEEYLNAVEGGTALVTQTKAKIAEIKAAIDAIPAGRLSDNVSSTQVSTLHTLLQDNTANFKSSMSSLLGISITFSDSDGD